MGEDMQGIEVAPGRAVKRGRTRELNDSETTELDRPNSKYASSRRRASSQLPEQPAGTSITDTPSKLAARRNSAEGHSTEGRRTSEADENVENRAQGQSPAQRRDTNIKEEVTLPEPTGQPSECLGHMKSFMAAAGINTPTAPELSIPRSQDGHTLGPPCMDPYLQERDFHGNAKNSILREGSWNHVVMAAYAKAKSHHDREPTVEEVLDEMRARVADFMGKQGVNAEVSDKGPEVTLNTPAPANGTQGQSPPTTLQAQNPLTTGKLGGSWPGESEGLRAVGTASASPSKTPPPVMQRQAHICDGQQGVQTSPDRTQKEMKATDNEEERLQDAAQVLMSLMQHPAKGGATHPSGVPCQSTWGTAHPGRISGTVPSSPPLSPGDRLSEDPECMGLEVDGTGRRTSQRIRRPNSRIHDELEPSELEKQWGKGRGRRSKPNAPNVPPAERRARSVGRGTNRRSSIPGGQGMDEQSGEILENDMSVDTAGLPPEGCRQLPLSLLRQLRERGGVLGGLEVIVKNDDGWMRARVQKNDFDFRKVVIKYTDSNQIATLNWHKEDTGSRVVVPLDQSACPTTSPECASQPSPAADTMPAQPQGTRPAHSLASASAGQAPAVPTAAVQQPPAELAGGAGPALHASAQQNGMPFVVPAMSNRLGMLTNMHFQAQAAAQHAAVFRQNPFLNGLPGLGNLQQASLTQLRNDITTLAAQQHMMQPGSMNPAVLQQLLAPLTENSPPGQSSPAVQAAAMQVLQRLAMQQRSALSQPPLPTGPQQPNLPNIPVGYPEPVELKVNMFPHLIEHLRSGSHQVKCHVRQGGHVRTGIISRVGSTAEGEGIVCDFEDDQMPRSQVILQKDLEGQRLSVECLHVLDGRQQNGVNGS